MLDNMLEIAIMELVIVCLVDAFQLWQAALRISCITQS